MHKIFRLKGVTAILFYLINNDMPNQGTLVTNTDLNPITIGRATDVLEAYGLVTITKGNIIKVFIILLIRDVRLLHYLNRLTEY